MVQKYNGQRTPEELTEFIVSSASKYYVKPINPNGEVVELNSKNFDELARSGPWFIKFFAPWCPHCQTLKPTWEKLGNVLKGKVNVGTVDCTVEGDICNNYSIRGYPTLKLLINGETTDYRGSRKLEELKKWAEKAVAAGAIKINADDFAEIREKEDLFFLFVYDSKTSAEAMTTINDLSKTFFSIGKFYVSDDSEILLQLGISEIPTFLVVKSDINYRYTSSASNAFTDVKSLKAFIQKHKYPLLTQIDLGNSEDILKGSKLVVLGIMNPKEKKFIDAKKSLRNVAVKYYSKVNEAGGNEGGREVVFAWIDGTRWSEYIGRMYGIKTASLPTVVIHDAEGDEYYDNTIRGTLFSVYDEAELYDAINDAKGNRLIGKSTISIIERFAKTTYNGIWNHPLITLSLFGVVFAAVWKIISRDHSSLDYGKDYPKFE
ncbi:2238_t:CDS:2 [Paraglomus brasilianum]|uniref:2238_t:CDS:1 n=1 Tax=Paraglomus brasilianum TaxID=144538 RepID=A0A9N8VTK3_9GLOM|nr:2238_t:CDS:2 [Paraglomus brasilianum]